MIPLINNSEDAIKYMGQKIKFICQKCGKEIERNVRKDRKRTYTIFLCYNCSREKTCLEKYGAKSNLVVQSNPKKYWEDHYDEILEKRQKTSIEKYGVESPNQSKEVQRKMVETKNKWRDDFEKENDCTNVKKLVNQYGQGWRIAKVIDNYISYRNLKFVANSDLYKIQNYFNEGRCHTNGYISKQEKELLKYIKSIYHGKIKENDTSSVPNLNHRYFELDIYLPELKIAFDFDGNYYHSSKFKDENYHQRKTLCCYKVGIRLAHILEYDWNNSKELIKDKIKRLLFTNESFNDGFFPSFDKNIKLSKPRKHIIGEFEYYDTGVII